MKKLISLLLILASLLSLASCASGSLETEEEILPTETGGGVIKLDVLPNDKRVADPLTWEKINAIPVANSSMTTDQLRQICMDFVEMQMTFCWTPSKTWEVTHGREDEYEVGLVYGGIPYVAESCGNMYKWMCYLDEKTGVLDVSSIGPVAEVQRILGVQCSGSVFSGWSRVANSFTWNGTGDITPAHNIILVGPYTYPSSIEDFHSNRIHTKKDVADVNGKDVMFESYASLLPADGLFFYHETAGHVLMCHSVEIVKDADGKIDGQKSKVFYYGQTASTNNYYQDNKIPVETQSGVKAQFSFNDLYERGYLPFGIKELYGLDPVEKAEAGCTVTSPGVSAEQLRDATVTSNYAISVIETRVYENGTNKVLYEKLSPVTEWPYMHTEEKLMGNFSSTELKKYADGKNVVEVMIRVNTGELLQAYSGTLVQ